MIKKSSREWLLDCPTLVVYDPDGWNRQDFNNSWNELITKKEFDKRVSHSTCLIYPIPD